MSFCKECGAEVTSDDLFCPECGVSLEGKGSTVKTAPREPSVPRPRKEEPAVPSPKKAEPAAPHPAKQVKTLTVGWLLCWILGIVFIIIGLTGMKFIGPGGLLFALLASLFLPPVQGLMRNKLHIELSGGMKIVLFIILFVGFALISNVRDQRNAPEVLYDEIYPPIDYETPPVLCEPKWECDAWGECQDGMHYRKCWDISSCGTDLNRPEMKESCSGYSGNYDNTYTGCEPKWECYDWGECLSDGVHYRECWDNNYCGTDLNKPETKEPCSGSTYTIGTSPGCEPSWECTEWTDCWAGVRYRSCWDNNYCGTEQSMPQIVETC